MLSGKNTKAHTKKIIYHFLTALNKILTILLFNMGLKHFEAHRPYFSTQQYNVKNPQT